MEYAEFSFVKGIDINRYDKSTGEEIAQWLTALMSTSGGLVVLYSNRGESDKRRDQWLMKLKDHVTTKWITNPIYRSLIQYKYMKTKEGQIRIYLFVSKSSSIVTFEYNAYGRHATGIEPMIDKEEVRKLLGDVRQGTTDAVCTSQLKELLGARRSFYHNEEIPTEYCESQTIEFKHYSWDDKDSNDVEFVASKIKSNLHRDNELLRNVSAFANTVGGSLILGVKEGGKSPVVIGFQTTDNQKQEEMALTSYLEKSLSDRCIWSGHHDNQPVCGTDWNVFYHNVSHPGRKLRKVIEIRVLRHSGGMFVKPPTCYVVNDNGDPVPLTFQEWRERLCPTKKEDKGNQHIQTHVRSSEDSPKELPDSSQPSTSKSISNVTTGAGDLPDSQHSETVNVKVQKSFEGEEVEITIHDLKLQDCCTGKMAKYLADHQGEKVWYPSVVATRMKNSDRIQYESLVKYINKTDWCGIATIIEIEREPSNQGYGSDTNVCLLCYVLIVSTKAHPKLIYCFGVDSLEETHDHEDYIRYALHHARKLKKKFLGLAVNKEHQSVLFHFEVQALIIPMTGYITQLWDSEGRNSQGGNNQPVSYPYVEHRKIFTIACNGLAEELLKTRYAVKDRHGDALIEHLTEEQARILLDRKERVLVVNGRSGTGKTVIALHLVQDARTRGYTKKEVLYICSSDGLKAFVTSQADCEVWVLNATNSLSKQQRDLLMETIKIIIVDDVHAISPSADWEENPNDLYCLLFTRSAQHEAVEVAIFFDPDQDFQSCLPEKFDTKLRNMAESMRGLSTQDIKLHTLKENIRNSRQINRFMQANQTQAKVEGSRVCLNEREGDGIIYDFIGNNVEENASYLDGKFRGLVQQYEERSIVVLCDDTTQMITLETILRDRFKWKLQNSQTFPAQGIVVSMLEDFGGLEGDVVLFLLPPSFGAENKGNWKYVNCISSRAKMKLEFLLPWDPDEDPIRLQKTQVFLELFQTVSIILS